MSDQNVCPYCGGPVGVYWKPLKDKDVYSELRGFCRTCGQHGPWVNTGTCAIHIPVEDIAIAAFCHPAHLHEYDPETQVAIKREDILRIYDDNCGDCMIGLRKCPPCDGCCMAAIRTAALEVGE